ncbi:MAG TPA: hypothetical protein VFO09_00495 [Methyloceanibacter sp.]|jgi:hypothetical protein|nr:hypothetical protein [Methyloceanibacter sp.]
MMQRAGIAALAVALVLAAAVGLWLYRGTVERDLADIKARLVSEAQLSNPSDAATASAIKLAPIQCELVFDLRSNRIAYALKGEEIDALWQHCQRIADVAAGLDKIERKPLP